MGKGLAERYRLCCLHWNFRLCDGLFAVWQCVCCCYTLWSTSFECDWLSYLQQLFHQHFCWIEAFQHDVSRPTSVSGITLYKQDFVPVNSIRFRAELGFLKYSRIELNISSVYAERTKNHHELAYFHSVRNRIDVSLYFEWALEKVCRRRNENVGKG